MVKDIKLLVDADACPVKREIIETAKIFSIPVWMIASYDHRLQEEEGVRTIQVDRSDQSADLYISNHVQAGDILVTQDFGLAAIGLSKRAWVISNKGRHYSNDTIDYLLDQRHFSAKQRKLGKYGKGPKPFTDQDRNIFRQTLTKLFHSLQENEK